MTAERDDTGDAATARPDESALAAARRFLAEHGQPARAVVENLGRAGARLVLVGDDGTVGDTVLPQGPAAAEAVVHAVDGLAPATWDTETVAALRFGPAQRRAMAGPRARR